MTQRLWSNKTQTPQPQCPQPFVTGSKVPPQSCILLGHTCMRVRPLVFLWWVFLLLLPSAYHSSLDLPFSSSPQGFLLPFKDHSDTFLGIFGLLSSSLQLSWREELPSSYSVGPRFVYRRYEYLSHVSWWIFLQYSYLHIMQPSWLALPLRRESDSSPFECGLQLMTS